MAKSNPSLSLKHPLHAQVRPQLHIKKGNINHDTRLWLYLGSLHDLYRPSALGVLNMPSHILQGYLRAPRGMTTVPEKLQWFISDYVPISKMMPVMLKGDIEQLMLCICYCSREALTVQQALRCRPTASQRGQLVYVVNASAGHGGGEGARLPGPER
jgi:hypothetical protein